MTLENYFVVDYLNINKIISGNSASLEIEVSISKKLINGEQKKGIELILGEGTSNQFSYWSELPDELTENRDLIEVGDNYWIQIVLDKDKVLVDFSRQDESLYQKEEGQIYNEMLTLAPKKESLADKLLTIVSLGLQYQTSYLTELGHAPPFVGYNLKSNISIKD